MMLDVLLMNVFLPVGFLFCVSWNFCFCLTNLLDIGCWLVGLLLGIWLGLGNVGMLDAGVACFFLL